MKVLVIHSYYQQRGGEDSVFEQEVSLLKEDCIVDTLIFYNKRGLKGIFQFLASIWNISASFKISKKIKEFNPDIVHVHNTHYALGPIVFRSVKKRNIPLVVTLHNYRLLCPSAILLNKGHIFLNSLNEQFPWTAIYNRVYRNSLLQTFWLALEYWFHQKIHTWNAPNKYILLSDFSKSLFMQSSLLAEEKISIKPNFVDKIAFEKSKETGGLLNFIYIGRLSEEKGIETLLETFGNNNLKLCIVGGGPMKARVQEFATKYENISYVGELDRNEVFQLIREMSAVIIPSICYESFGLTMVEAFSQSIPVIASNIGTPSFIIKDGYNGFLYDVANCKDLQLKLELFLNLSDKEIKEMSLNAYTTYIENYTSEKNKELLLSIYKEAIEEVRL